METPRSLPSAHNPEFMSLFQRVQNNDGGLGSESHPQHLLCNGTQLLPVPAKWTVVGGHRLSEGYLGYCPQRSSRLLAILSSSSNSRVFAMARSVLSGRPMGITSMAVDGSNRARAVASFSLFRTSNFFLLWSLSAVSQSGIYRTAAFKIPSSPHQMGLSCPTNGDLKKKTK